MPMAKKVKRLFEQFQPEHYDLYIKPDTESMTFNGIVTIVGRKTGRPSQRLTFHQKDLRISAAHVTYHGKKGNEEIKIDRINTQNSFDEVRLHSAQMLYPGKYTIRLEFGGKITRPMRGLYPSFYKYKNKDKVILVTQLESHYAREVFPSIDEPEAKATFDLTLATPKGETALSNTPIKEQSTKDSLQETTFETTPKMSTYLLAFASGELHSVETKTKAGVTVRSWASVSQPKTHLEYSAKEAADVLDFFASYFNIPYPLKKLDQLALPDFDSAAMENWGLVTYREMALLVDPKNRSISSEQFVTLVISHELSHQWFGNLVTMKWWDELWLNESFAGLMEHMAPAALHPDWHQWELYAMSDIALITSRDVYKDIQAVSVEVHDPDLIGTLFDPAIVYAKGARLLKMLREFIGEEAFAKGLEIYFNANMYGNATRHDLWQALSHSSGKDIETFMTPWLNQSGMPVLHVTQNGKTLDIEQERFLLDGETDSSLWPIPLLANYKTRPDAFSSKTTRATLASNEYVLINQNASGQYITHYTKPKHREYLGKALETTSIPTEARINILNDIYMLARHGDASLTDALDLIITCSNEPRDSVWGMVSRTVQAAGQLTEGDEKAEKQLKGLKLTLGTKLYEKLGWEDSAKDTPNTKQLRHTMIALMISGEDSGAIKEALRKYHSAKSLSVIDAELRNTILVAAVKHEGKKIVEQLLSAYKSASSEIQLDITTALSATHDPILAKKIIHTAMGKNGFVRAQDVMRWVALFLRNHYVRHVMWDFMVEQWDWIAQALESSKSFDYLPTYAASIISTEQWAKKYRELFEPKKNIKTLERNIKIGMADIEARLAWRTRDEAKIKKWLAANVKALPESL